MKRFILLISLALTFIACSQQSVPVVDGEVLEETAVNPVLTPATPSSRLLAPGSRSITFTVTTQDPSVVKSDSSNKTFSAMNLTATSTNNNRTHNFRVSLQANKPYTFYIKAAPKNNPSSPYALTRKVNYRVTTPYEPTFPRLFTLWWPEWGQWQDVTVERLSKLSVFAFNLHGYHEANGFKPIAPSVFEQAREQNPSLRILTQLYSTNGCDTSYCDELERVDNDPDHPLYKKIFVRKANGDLWTYGAGQDWEHPVYNLSHPETVQYLLQKNLALWRNDLLTFDGVFMDNCWRGFEGVNDGRGTGISRPIDLDGNRVADNAVARDRAYEYGLQEFLRGLRSAMPNAVIICNAIGGYPNKTALHTPGQSLKDRQGNPFSYLSAVSGKEFEDNVYALGEEADWLTFRSFMNEYRAWCKSPCFTFVPSKGGEDDDGTDDKNFEDFKAMRFGLATVLMGDGLYLRNVYATWSKNSWFDEYDVNLGYATQGSGEPIATGFPVWRRDFDNGIALVNTSKTQSIIVQLGGTFKAIQGSPDQDPDVNNGRTVTRIRLEPLDGRILLRP
jgi:hypothetical protein